MFSRSGRSTRKRGARAYLTSAGADRVSYSVKERIRGGARRKVIALERRLREGGAKET
jgi:hypothetical protein